MKNQFLISMLILSFTALGGLLLSCGKESVAPKDYHLLNVNTIISQFNGGKSEEDKVKRTEGDIRIIVSDDRIIILHDIPDNTLLNTYYLLRNNENLNLRSNEFGLAEVLFLENCLIVNSLERDQTLLFSLTGEIYAYHLMNQKKLHEFTGFGIGMSTSTRGIIPRNGPECRCELVATPSTDCEEGGSESSECSISTLQGNCSVNCGQGYYACCDKEG